MAYEVASIWGCRIAAISLAVASCSAQAASMIANPPVVGFIPNGCARTDGAAPRLMEIVRAIAQHGNLHDIAFLEGLLGLRLERNPGEEDNPSANPGIRFNYSSFGPDEFPVEILITHGIISIRIPNNVENNGRTPDKAEIFSDAVTLRHLDKCVAVEIGDVLPKFLDFPFEYNREPQVFETGARWVEFDVSAWVNPSLIDRQSLVKPAKSFVQITYRKKDEVITDIMVYQDFGYEILPPPGPD